MVIIKDFIYHNDSNSFKEQGLKECSCNIINSISHPNEILRYFGPKMGLALSSILTFV